MPAARRWIRLDVGWEESEWLAELPTGARLAWVLLLGHVKTRGVGGRAKAPSTSIIARKWDIQTAEVDAMIRAAVEHGALSIRGAAWIVTDWDQFCPPRRFVPNTWKLLRLQILERDGWVCRYCGGHATQVDHVTSRKNGGTDDPDNLVSACGFCNRSKNFHTLAEWGARQERFGRQKRAD